MRFLVDECTGPIVAAWLRDKGHAVFSVYEESRGMDDNDIIQMAYEEDWILITNDKDFGNKVFRDGRLHRGVILLRLARIFHELLSRDLGDGRATGKPQWVGPEAYLNSTSQGPTTEDARKDGHILGRSR